ncbi:hypothetical protein DL93DRAFT_2167600 [Clavulina sp. PMI_390]|nr:hypothetical protein DL93DRAFT_2167600 [Clavulina sp. PMI_390]
MSVPRGPPNAPPHHHDLGTGIDDNEESQGPRKLKKRSKPDSSHATTACQPCRAAKAKCDTAPNTEGASCSRCKEKSLKCKWSESIDKRRNVDSRIYLEQVMINREQEKTIADLRKENMLLRQIVEEHNLPMQLASDHTTAQPVSDCAHSGDERRRCDCDMKRVGQGFGSTILPTPFAEAFAPGAPAVQSCQPHIPGFLHSESRVAYVNPIHELTGRETLSSTHWSDCLPSDETGRPLITREQHDDIVTKSLRFITSLTLPVIPHLFLRDLSTWTEAPRPKPRVHHYAAMLHNVLIAIGLPLAEDSYLRSRTIQESFITEAKKSLDEEERQPTLSTIQGLALLSTYYNGLGEYTKEWMCLGKATNGLQALGMHSQLPSRRVANDDYIERALVYQSVLTQHRRRQLYLGRNQALPLSEGDMKDTPTDLRLDNIDLEWTSPQGDSFTTKALLSKSFVAEVQLMSLVPGIMKVLSELDLEHWIGSKKQIHGVAVLRHFSIGEWREKLPLELRISDPANQTSPPQIFLVNLEVECLSLLLLESFYQLELYAPTPSHPIPNIQTQSRSQPSPAASSSQLHPRPKSQHVSPSIDGTLIMRREVEAYIDTLVAIANKECVKAADRALAILERYHELFGVGNSHPEIVEMVYRIGQTSLRGITTRVGAGKRIALAGERARTRVHKSIEWLKAIGKSWPSGLDAAQKLEWALEGSAVNSQVDYDVEAQHKIVPSTSSMDPVASLGINELGYLSTSGSSPPSLSQSLGASSASWPNSFAHAGTDGLMVGGSLFPNLVSDGNSTIAVVPTGNIAASAPSATTTDPHSCGLEALSATSYPAVPPTTEPFLAPTLVGGPQTNEGTSATLQPIHASSANQTFPHFSASSAPQDSWDVGGPVEYANPHGTGSEEAPTLQSLDSSAALSTTATASDLRIRSSPSTSVRFHPYALPGHYTNENQNAGGQYSTDPVYPAQFYDDGMYAWCIDPSMPS